MTDCKDDGCRDLHELRRDLEEKHRQNRADIHAIRNDQQKIVLQVTKLEGKVEPLVDNGQPGLISRMSDKLDEVIDQLTQVRIAQGSESGGDKANEWWRTALVAIIVALVSALAAHFWK